MQVRTLMSPSLAYLWTIFSPVQNWTIRIAHHTSIRAAKRDLLASIVETEPRNHNSHEKRDRRYPREAPHSRRRSTGSSLDLGTPTNYQFRQPPFAVRRRCRLRGPFLVAVVLAIVVVAWIRLHQHSSALAAAVPSYRTVIVVCAITRGRRQPRNLSKLLVRQLVRVRSFALCVRVQSQLPEHRPPILANVTDH